jgi:hypothetical protein
MKKYVLAKTDLQFVTAPGAPVRTYFYGFLVGKLAAYGTDPTQATQYDSAAGAQAARTVVPPTESVAKFTVHEIDGEMIQDLGV